MKICFLDARSLGKDLDLSPLEALGSLTLYDNTLPEQVPGRIRDTVIVITNKIALPPPVLEGTAVRLIAISATGANVVDLDGCQRLGIGVCNVAGYSTRSVAQHTVALALGLLRNLPWYDRYTRSGAYQESAWPTHLEFPFFGLEGKTWGIIGMGNIGTETARLAQAFGCQILYHSTGGRSRAGAHPSVPLEEILAQSSVLSVHAPLNENTRYLIGYRELCRMRPEAILINVARGGIVEETAVVRAIREERIGGYATDVLEREPQDPGCPLLELGDSPRLLMTPHMAFGSNESLQRLLQELCENIAAFGRGERRNRLE